jgi:hypothetical protein
MRCSLTGVSKIESITVSIGRVVVLSIGNIANYLAKQNKIEINAAVDLDRRFKT